MSSLANSEDQDEVYYAAFHQCLQCLPRQNQSSEKEVQCLLGIITCNPLIYTVDPMNLLQEALWKIPLV